MPLRLPCPPPAFRLPPEASSTTPAVPILYPLQISEQRRIEMSRILGDNIQPPNISTGVPNNPTVADDRSEILAWLSPVEPRIRHQDIRARRVDKLGGWLLRTDEYRNWFDGNRKGKPDNAVLFCYGGPGVGKTHIRYDKSNAPQGKESYR